MDEMAIEVNGEHLMLDAAGALWWPSESTLVFADLHFEKGSFASNGCRVRSRRLISNFPVRPD